MIFKAIQDRFKVKSARKFVEDELGRKRPLSGKKGVSNIACVLDMDGYDNADSFLSLRKQLGLNPNGIHVIGYKRGKDVNGMFSIPFCNDRELGWNGSIENGDFMEFVAREYDVLINYFTDDRLLLKVMSAKVSARIRVGLSGADTRMNDLIFDCKLGDFKTFSKELEKYLRILKEIK